MAEPENSRYASVILFVTSCMSYFLIGFHFTTMVPLVPALQEIYNDTYTKRNEFPLPSDVWVALLTLTVSFVLVGGFVGGCCNKFLLSILSRKHLLQVTHCLNLIGVVIICLVGGLTGSYEAVIVGRLLVGIPLGVYFTLVAMFNAETSARKKHPAWQSITATSLIVGLFVGPALSHPKGLGTTVLWPVAVSFGALPSLLYLTASFWFPETPYYLIREGKTEEALELLGKLRTGNKDDIKMELNEMENEINKSNTVLSLKEILSTKQYRRIFVSAVVIFAGYVLNGAGHFIFYTDILFLQAGIDPETVTFATLGVFGLQCILCIPAYKIIDRFGGRKVLIGSTIVVLLSEVLFTISQITSHLASNVMPIIAVLSTGILICSYWAFMTPSILVVLSDITTEPIRPTAFGYGSMVLWFFAWLVGFLAPYLQGSFGPYAVTIWIGCTILYVIFQFRFLPETKGKSPEQIQNFFK